MGWAIGYNEMTKQDVGYGVPAYCDHPDCHAKIDRGLDYVCGGAGEPMGGEHGCGLHFCHKHLTYDRVWPVCERCLDKQAPFAAKPDHPEWVAWKLTDESWREWREQNPDEVKRLAGSRS